MTRVAVLQLDTRFPRIPGDIACPESYQQAPEIIRISNARVANIVHDRPDQVDIAPFIEAARRSMGDVVATSCGFLAPFEAQLAAEIDRPFLASSLNALPSLRKRYAATEIQILTFNETALCSAHLPADEGRLLDGVIGLEKNSHLRQVIENDLPELDAERARAEILTDLTRHTRDETRLILLECTNLPPYKQAIRAAFSVDMFDILDRIEAAAPGAIRSAFLS